MAYYENEDCRRFVADMEKAGITAHHYTGRYFWAGPAVIIDGKNRDKIARLTSVTLQQDDFGTGLVIYPVSHGGDERRAKRHSVASGQYLKTPLGDV